MKIDKNALDKTAEKAETMKVERKEEYNQFSEKEGNSERISSKKSVDSVSLNATRIKVKRKHSFKRNDYRAFYQLYYRRYQKEH